MILVFLDPFSNDFPVVNLEIVKNDVDLPLNVLPPSPNTLTLSASKLTYNGKVQKPKI